MRINSKYIKALCASALLAIMTGCSDNDKPYHYDDELYVSCDETGKKECYDNQAGIYNADFKMLKPGYKIDDDNRYAYETIASTHIRFGGYNDQHVYIKLPFKAFSNLPIADKEKEAIASIGDSIDITLPYLARVWHLDSYDDKYDYRFGSQDDSYVVKTINSIYVLTLRISTWYETPPKNYRLKYAEDIAIGITLRDMEIRKNGKRIPFQEDIKRKFNITGDWLDGKSPTIFNNILQ